MKKLTKIKLVNWHLFSNQTIEINDNTLISGQNGAGKSTLLDAVQYLLVGGRSGAKFNIAANEDAKRTLEGYVRGRIGSETREYLRENDVITHVALEFYDEDNDQYHIIGVVLDLPKNARIKERFYLIENTTLHDTLFLEGNVPKNFKLFRDYLSQIEKEVTTFDTQGAYRDALASFFGMDARKYAKILPKALAFKPIDLQQFIFDFLLDDDPVDIRSLRNNVEQLKKVETQIIKDREKLTKLDEINNVGEEIIANKDQIIIGEIINQLNFIEQREIIIDNNLKEEVKVEQNLTNFQEQRRKIDINLEEIDAQILNLERIKSQDDVERTLSKYQESLNIKSIEYEDLKNTIFNLNENLTKEFTILKELSNKLPSTAFKDFVTYYQQNQNKLNSIELRHLISNVAVDRETYLEAYTIQKDKVEGQRQTISNEIYEVKGRISNLKRNVKDYPVHVQKLINLLNEELSGYYQKNIKVSPLAELIEVNDEKWRNALEGQLGGQKFNIIVEPEYYDFAIKTYEDIQKTNPIYGVGLVNTKRLPHSETNPNSLASKIDTDNVHARNAINMYINSVITVNEALEFNEHSRAITPQGMTYSNYTARQLDPRSYQTPYIGTRAIDTQLEIEVAQLTELEKQMEALSNNINNLNADINLLRNLKSHQIIHQNQIKAYEEIKDVRRDFTILEEQISSLLESPSIAKLEDQLVVERNKRRELGLERDGVLGQIATTRNQLQVIREATEEAKTTLERYQKDQNVYAKEHPDKLSLAHTQFYALKQRHRDYTTISNEIQKENFSLNQQIAKKETELTNLMRMYNREYFFSSEPNYNQIDDYLKEAAIIRSNNLVKYEHEATELRRNSEIGFREEFVNKLRASILTAQQQIEDLNSALEGKKFGHDSYKLIYGASLDPEYKVYYDMIMDNTAVDDHKLFTEGLNRKNEQILMELFNKISSSDPQFDRLSYEFLDYRKYMDYDIEVIHDNGTKSLFSKVSKEKSGGETQVPFYIVIAASFQQLLSRNKRMSSGCIVLFDEAFNNMDSGRIDAMMKYYSSLSIQLLIAIPPQRVEDIVNYVNTALIVHKVNDYAEVEAFSNNMSLLE